MVPDHGCDIATNGLAGSTLTAAPSLCPSLIHSDMGKQWPGEDAVSVQQ